MLSLRPQGRIDYTGSAMEESSTIAVKLGNPVPGADQRAPFGEFTNVVNAIRSCLNQIERCIERPGSKFVISNLEIGSAILELEPVGTGSGAEVAEVFNDTISALEVGRPVDPRLDYGALKCFSGFSALSKSRESQLTIGALVLTSSFFTNLQSLIGEAATTHGSVSGLLEAILLHNRNRFTLYPAISNESIDCDFKPTDLERVLAAAGRHVTVYGVLHHSRAKVFPNRVEVDTFEIEPDNSGLPTLLDTRWTGPLPVDSPMQIEGQFSDEWF